MPKDKEIDGVDDDGDPSILLMSWRMMMRP